jgi:putative acetyltransferase
MTPTLRSELDADRDALRQVHRLAFGRDIEATLVDELRTGRYVRVSVVAEINGQVVGHILFSDLAIVTAEGVVPALALAPLAVLPEHQRQGVGSALTRRGLEVARDSGHRIVVVLGHPAYYPRFGFSAELARRLESPYSGPAFMALELVDGALDAVTGRLEYAPPLAQFS